MFYVIDDNGFLFRVDHPVLPHTGVYVFVVLESHILSARGRRQDLDQKIRRAKDAAVAKTLSVADDHDVRLYDGAVVFIELHIHGGDQRDAGALVLQDVVQQLFMEESPDDLVERRGSGHVVKHAVDQLNALLVRKGEIILERVAILPAVNRIRKGAQ